jgi:hypothetical protein
MNKGEHGGNGWDSKSGKQRQTRNDETGLESDERQVDKTPTQIGDDKQQHCSDNWENERE